MSAKATTAAPTGRKKAAEWKRVRVGETLRLVNGSAFKPTDWTNDGLPIVRIQNLNNPDAPYNRTTRQLPEKFKLRGGELLFAWSGTPGTSFGAHIWRGGEAWLNQHIFNVLFDENEWDKKFLQFAINQNLADYIRAAHGGAGLAHITKGRFEESELFQPAPGEQRRIVAEIEKQFTRLEAGVAALRRVQANLKRYRAAVLKAACEGQLVPTEAELTAKNAKSTKAKTNSVSASSALSAVKNPGYETGAELLTRILAERRAIHDRAQATAARKKKYKEPTPPVIPVGEKLPSGWTWATWEQIGFSQNGRPFQSAEYQPSGFKLLRPGNLHVSGKVIWNEDNTRCMPQKRANENPDLIVRGGELVMNLTAQSLKDEFLGRVCMTGADEECLLNQRLARLSPIIVSSPFVLYLLKAWRFRRYVDGLNSGSLIQHMFTSQLAEFTFPLPPLAEQTRIVAEVERRLSVVEEMESVVSANLQRATRLRQSILQKAFSGELVCGNNLRAAQ